MSHPISYRSIAAFVGNWAIPCLFVLAGTIMPALAHDAATASITVCFVPEEACASRIVAAIDGAHTEIRVQAYGFTSPPILDALVRAEGRGVDVAVLLDKSNQRETSSGAMVIAHAEIPVWIDRPSGIAHNKVIVIDRRLVVGGSMNYTKSAASRNVENVTFTESPEVAGWFLENWSARRAVSAMYVSDN
jgi:phospholipase D